MESGDQKLVSSFFTAKDKWTRMCHTSTLYSHFVITFAGQNPEEGNEYTDLCALDLEADTMEKIEYTGDKIPVRSSHSANLFDNNKILIFGGVKEREVYQDMYVLTLEENAETKKLSVVSKKTETKGTILSRHNHYTFVYENALYSYGGEDKKGDPQQGLWKLDLENWTWSECKTTGEKPKFLMKTATGFCGEKAYFLGGIDSEDESVANSFFSLDLKNLKWSQVKSSGTVPKERMGATFQEYKNKLYLFGGNFTDDAQSFDDVHVFDPTTESWTRLQVRQTKEQPVGRIYHTCVGYKNSLIIWGGFDDASYIPTEIFKIVLDGETKEEKEEKEENEEGEDENEEKSE